MQIVFLDSYTTLSTDLTIRSWEGMGHVRLYDYSTKEEGLARAKDAEIVITNKYIVDDECLKQWSKCRYIIVAATGYNNVDINACKAYDVKVSNVRGYSTSSVVQHVFASLFACTNKVEKYSMEVTSGRWQANRDFTFYDHSITEVSGMTMGVYGLGTIGAKVAEVAHAFGMKVIGVSKYPKSYSGSAKLVEKNDLLSMSDIVSLHVPLNDSTRQLINFESLNLVKSNGILINTSRGPLVNETDLAVYLKNNPKYTAVLDVLCSEPPLADNPLIGLDNCHITPHQAWASQQARNRLLDGIKYNIIAYLGGEPVNLVSS